MALSGTFYGSTNNQYIQPKIVWKATQSVSGNYSTVTATLYYSRTNTGYTTYGTGTFGITINGSTKSESKSVQITYNSNTVAVTHTVTVSHNANGTKSITISGSGSIPGTSFSSTSISATVLLDTIPRATMPTLSASSIDMGGSLTINTPRASSSFTHDLAYTFAGGSWTSIATGVGTSKTWTVPDLASKIPNASSGTMTIRCITKSGSASIGTKTVSLTVKVPSSVIPTVGTVTVAEATSGLAAQFGAYIQKKSKLSVSIAASGAGGSTISSYSATFDGQSYTAKSFTTPVISSSGTLSLKIRVKDSRGRWSAYKTVSVTVLAYTPPKIQAFSVYRCNASGTAVDDGVYIAVRYKYSVPSLNGGNTATMAVKYKQSTATSYSSLLSGSAINADTTAKPTTPTFSVDYQYDIQITVTDWFGASAAAVTILPSGKVVLDIKANGLGLGVGKTAEFDKTLDSAWGVRVAGFAAVSCKLLLTRSKGWASGETVSLPELADCDAVLVVYCSNTGWSTTYLRSIIVPVGMTGVLEAIVNVAAAATLIVIQRRLTVTTTGITSGSVYLKSFNSSAAAEDNTNNPYACSPYKIYGLKW